MIGPLPDAPLDRGYDSGKTRDLLEILGYQGQIAATGVPAPIQGRQTLARRAHALLAQRLRQAAPLHR